MSWLQLRLDCEKDAAESLEDALLAAGALSVTFEDREDEPMLEPGVGETPLWKALRITGLFAADTDGDALMAYVDDLPGATSARLEILEDKDWEREWMQHYQPMQYGQRLWICPSWIDPPDPDAINLLLDPGLAFGTGTHPTTAMCLRALDGFTLEYQLVVDYGCGSGILGIAALRLGARELLAIDNDPQALIATRDNAQRNGVDTAAITIGLPDDKAVDLWNQRGDLVVANILAGPLAALSETLCTLLRPGGRLIMAGLLESQAEVLIDHYAPRLALHVREQQEEWVCLEGMLPE